MASTTLIGGSGSTSTSGTSSSSTTKSSSLQVTFQPAFASQIQTIRQPLSSSGDNSIVLPNTSIQRGFIIQDKNFVGNSVVGFQFQYNPSTISATQTVQTTGAALSYMLATPQDGASVLAPTNTTVAFTVMCDRTYELWKSPFVTSSGQITTVTNGNGIGELSNLTNDPAMIGCYTDIYQMMQLTGMTQNVNNAQINSGIDVSQAVINGGGTIQTSTTGTSTGIMQMIPCWTFVSPTTGTMTYYGFITEWDYTVTHWTQFMVPMRCAIDVTLQLLPIPTNTISLPGLTSGSANIISITPAIAGIPGV